MPPIPCSCTAFQAPPARGDTATSDRLRGDRLRGIRQPSEKLPRGRDRRAWTGALTAALLLAACADAPKEQTTPAQSVDKLYEEARSEMAIGAYDKAAKLFERMEGRAAGTLMAQQAQLEQAHALYKGGEKAQALAVIERFLKLHPTSPAADYAYYLQGLLNFNDDLGLFGRLASIDLSERDQQASRDAFQSFKQLVDQFPDSKYAPDARLRMHYIINALAAYEVHVARYYYKRGAYVAAANRAQQTVQEFRSAPAVEEALYLMMASYDQLGLEQLRDDARRVLTKNFPESELLERGYGNTSKPWWKLF
jgi:outer membrane protein assembly factor BamD